MPKLRPARPDEIIRVLKRIGFEIHTTGRKSCNLSSSRWKMDHCSSTPRQRYRKRAATKNPQRYDYFSEGVRGRTITTFVGASSLIPQTVPFFRLPFASKFVLLKR